MRASAELDIFGAHRVVDDPATADLILFVETSGGAGYYFERVLRHPLYREQPSKCYLFSSTDRLIPLLPGVFASIERRWNWPSWTRGGFYLGVRERPGLSFETGSPGRYLFSFVGAATSHSVRSRIVGLTHPRGLVVDTTGKAESGAPGRVRPDDGDDRYARSIKDASFVLCPRGGGVSTFRLFEAMMLGRAPVIISDQLVLPQGPDWGAFSLRVPEAEVSRIPSLLEQLEKDAEAMGGAARRAWLEWFSPEAGFHRTVEWCLELQTRAPARRGLRRYSPRLQMLRPYHAARRLKKQFSR